MPSSPRRTMPASSSSSARCSATEASSVGLLGGEKNLKEVRSSDDADTLRGMLFLRALLGERAVAEQRAEEERRRTREEKTAAPLVGADQRAY